MKEFFEKVGSKLQDLSELKIRTLVGDITFNEKEDSFDFKNGQKVDGMISTINLVSGDIDTKLSPKFATEYELLREYHLIKENQGQEIMKKNMELLQSIAKTLITLRDAEKTEAK